MAALALIAGGEASAAPRGDAPTVRIDRHPHQWTRYTVARFAWFKRGEVTRSRCRLDAGAWRACSRTPSYPRVSAGRHTFTVQVSGPGGSDTASVSWRVDLAAPAPPSVVGGSLQWSAAPSQTISARGGRDADSGVAGYQYRVRLGAAPAGPAQDGDRVAVSAQGESWVQFRTRDRAGNVSPWAPAARSAEGIARLDRTAPAPPSVVGGDLAWQTVDAVTVTAGGASDAISGIVGYESRYWRDGAAQWTMPAINEAVSIPFEGTTFVQFRTVDAAGLHSPWAPARPQAGNTVRLDREDPTAPVVVGGSAAWQRVSSVRVSAAGSLDEGTGVSGYRYRLSGDGGATWGAPHEGDAVAVDADGETLVQFQALDGAGNVSAWAPEVPTADSIVRLDRDLPLPPTLSVEEASWTFAPSVLAVAGAGIDPLSGVEGYEYRLSSDGGATWGAPETAASPAGLEVSGEGVTLIQARSVDRAGNASAWAPAAADGSNVVRIDRGAPTAPAVAGGSDAWRPVDSIGLLASGSTDGLSGVAGARVRTSVDGGATWSAPTPGASVDVTDEGETLVQFQSLDAAGNASEWAPAEGARARIDRTAPSAPQADGGSFAWRSVTAAVVSAVGGDDGAAPVASYLHRTSSDGGATWSAAAPGGSVVATAEGQLLVQFRAVDAAGNTSPWGPAGGAPGSTVRIDRTAPAEPVVTGGSSAWRSAAAVVVDASGSTDALAGVERLESRTSADGGASWSAPAPGASLTVAAEGETLVQFRAVDAAGNASAWAPSQPTPSSTVRLDRSAPLPPASPAAGGSLGWLHVAATTVRTDAPWIEPLSGVAGFEARTSVDGGATWSAATPGASATVSAEGETLVQFRAVDAAGNVSAWAPAAATAATTVRIDRTLPTVPAVVGGSAGWTATPAAFTASGSVDVPGSGVDRVEHRTSIDGGTTWSAPLAGAALTVARDGETLVQFRAVDVSGLASAWEPIGGALARVDAAAPTPPRVTGGSAAWLDVPSVTVTADGSVDAHAGFDRLQQRISTDAGATWTDPVDGDEVTVSRQGETLVQFRAIDAIGNVGPWTPADRNAAATVRIDHDAPTEPVVLGGSSAWTNAAAVAVAGSLSTDSPGSGVAFYEHQMSVDGGATWLPAVVGATATVTNAGTTLVRFRAVDEAGFRSGWAPAMPSSDATARIDRAAPTAPAVTGGSLAWQDAASLTVGGAGSTDAGGSGMAGYEHRISRDGGASWTAPAPGASATVAAEGETIVQVRARDAAGNTSTWAPATAGAANTIRIDRAAPTAPAVSGGSATWSAAGGIVVSAAGADDGEGSGVTGYEYRTSADGGATWGTVRAGASTNVTTQGVTVVQFRAKDAAGYTSEWAPATPTAASTVRLDRTIPTAPSASGGSSSWQNGASVSIGAVGGSDAASGVDHIEHRTSMDGGKTWSNPATGPSVAVTGEGTTIVQFRTVDVAGNASAWAPAAAGPGNTVKIDRTAPSAPTVAGGSDVWQSRASIRLTPTGSSDTGGAGLAPYQWRSSTDGGETWRFSGAGVALDVTLEGETVAQFRAVDTAGNASAWSDVSEASTARLDRTAPTLPTPVASGSGWQNVATATVTATASTDLRSGLSGYQVRTSPDNGRTWTPPLGGSVATVSAEGETLVQFQAVDRAGNVTPWTPATPTVASRVQIDRSAPRAPSPAGGSLQWQTGAGITVSAAGAADTPGSGVARVEYRTSRDGGATWSASAAGGSVTVLTEGETLVQFRAVDVSGLASDWFPATPSPASTVRLDRTAPAAPAVGGGSLTWSTAGAAAIAADAGADTGGSGFAGLQYRTSADNGASWTAPTAGATAVIVAEGQTLVQFRGLDGAGNASAWAPGAPGAANTVRLDRAAPSAPAATGGSLAWQSVAGVSVSASGTTDGPGSGVALVEHRVSADNGVTWSAPAAGAAAAVTGEGQTIVQFRATDALGHTSAWAPAVPSAGSTVRIDRTAPGAPAVAGGSLTWRTAASVTVSGGGSADDRGPAVSYQHRLSSDGGLGYGSPVNGAAATIAADGETVVQFRALDAAGNASAWAPASPTPASTVRLDRTGPSAPLVSGGSLAWSGAPSRTASAAGADDDGGGVAGYEHRVSLDGGVTWTPPTGGDSFTAAREGETVVQFRAVDELGNVSAWAPTTPGGANTIRLDRSGPTAPTVTGGSAAWRSLAVVDVSAGGSADDLSGVAGLEHRLSTDGGSTWTVPVAGDRVSVSDEGDTRVQFRAVDAVGNASTWAPAGGAHDGTVRIDRTRPQAPTATGGSLSWARADAVVLRATGATDAGGAGVAGLEHRTSQNGGADWGAPVPGAEAAIAGEGETLVQFRSVDGAGNASDWAPATPGAAVTVRLDRTGPTAPAVAGGSLTWLSAASTTITAGGSADDLTALDRYEHRLSTDGGATWSAAVPGASATVSREGQTLVQFRAVDVLGNTSPWTPGGAGSVGTVRLDRTAPNAPTAHAGGSLTPTHADSVTVVATGATDALSGSIDYAHRVSTDGGDTWSAAAPGPSVTVADEGETLVQFRVADAAGNASPWAPDPGSDGATVRIDRTAPDAPAVAGGSAAWGSVAPVRVTAAGVADAARYEHRVSRDGGVTWLAPRAGATASITADGEALLQFRALDAAGNASPWAPATPTPASTVRLDRTAPSAPAVAGGSLLWQSVAEVSVAASGASDTLSGFGRYEHRTSRDGGRTWSAAATGAVVTVTDEGETLVQFRVADAAGNLSPWAPASSGGGNTARIDRTRPSAPTVSGGSSAWRNAPSATVSGGAATDALSGLARYEHRLSTDGGASWTAPRAGAAAVVTAQGETLAEFRAVDLAGNVSPWSPASTPAAAATVRLDRAAPTAPAVSGGSLAWQSAASVTVAAAGAADSPGSGIDRYEVRTSTDGGATWSAAAPGAAATVSQEGETVVQFRAVDRSGKASSWAPALNSAANTVRLDRTAPARPIVRGGSSAWQDVASVRVTAQGASDNASGLAGYEYRTSADEGATWSASAPGAALTVADEGSLRVQFRSRDRAGNVSHWAPSLTADVGIVRIDRGAPSLPSASGGSLAWTNAASATVTASGSTDLGAGLARYEYRTSRDAGATWSTPSASGTARITLEGETLVQFRAVDRNGAFTEWAPSTPTPAATVRIDRAPPTAPAVSGGSAVCSASRTISAAGSSDARAGGVVYEGRRSADNGATWTAPAAGASITLALPDVAAGTYLVQFRAVDAAGNASAWGPGPGAIACLR